MQKSRRNALAAPFAQVITRGDYRAIMTVLTEISTMIAGIGFIIASGEEVRSEPTTPTFCLHATSALAIVTLALQTPTQITAG